MKRILLKGLFLTGGTALNVFMTALGYSFFSYGNTFLFYHILGWESTAEFLNTLILYTVVVQMIISEIAIVFGVWRAEV